MNAKHPTHFVFVSISVSPSISACHSLVCAVLIEAGCISSSCKQSYGRSHALLQSDHSTSYIIFRGTPARLSHRTRTSCEWTLAMTSTTPLETTHL